MLPNNNIINNIAIPENPEDFTALYNYISLLSQRKEYDKCGNLLYLLVNFIRGMEFNERKKTPQILTGYRLIAENHIKKGEISAAEALCREGLDIFPYSDELKLCYGKCLIQLHQFELSERIFKKLYDYKTPSYDNEICNGLYTYRLKSALGELYQNWGKTEDAQIHFNESIEYNPQWMPAHVGLVEIEIIKRNPHIAEQYLSMIINKFGNDSTLLLLSANVAIILSKFDEAEDIIIRLKGELLGEDRFEYLLFLIDFFKGDYESLSHLPNMITGETVETEAARVWLNKLKGFNYKRDALRIPEEIWKDEYINLDNTWEEINREKTES